MKRTVFTERLMPVRIVESGLIKNAEQLLKEKEPSVVISFDPGVCEFTKKGAYVVLDFGKEIAGTVRIITQYAGAKCNELARFRITTGESLNEALSSIDEKGAVNDHAVRDTVITVTGMSDQRYLQTGFRYVRLELADDISVGIQNIFAENSYDKYKNELSVKTDDRLLNKILDTAKYTVKLCMQGGYIWDGIKRDRLVWAGDLHQEVVSSLYIWGDNENVKNSLELMKKHPTELWINHIPSYSAWWVINLLSYVEITGNTEYFNENREYAVKIIEKIHSCITEENRLEFKPESSLQYFLDWPTCNTPDAYVGTVALVKIMAQRFLRLEENQLCRDILSRLSLDLESVSKQVAAFKALAGEKIDSTVLDKDGAQGFSTFMAYYILTAYFRSGGKNSIQLIKEYFGKMLEMGATTFWEDFDVTWTENATGINEHAKAGKNDIHGDFGKFCYNGFRHSLCHGWSAGVLAFFIESILGITVEGDTVRIAPDYTGKAQVSLPVKEKTVKITFDNGTVTVKAPNSIKIIK